METKGFLQFEIFINVLVSFFRFIWIPVGYGSIRPLEIFQFFQCGDRVYTSESDVCRRQILTYKDGPRTERFNNSYSVIETTVPVNMSSVLIIYLSHT